MADHRTSDVVTGGEVPELIDMTGSRMAVVARMGAADGNTVLIRSTMQPGKRVPLHSHVDPECFYVLSGRFEAFIDDGGPGWRRVEPGMSLLVAGGVRHAVRNAGDEPVDLVLATNGRLARFFREAGRPAVPGSPIAPPTAEDLARMVRTAAVYGYWMATPAESAAITG